MAGQRGGDKVEYEFQILSGELLTAFLKPYFYLSHHQPPLLVGKDGNVMSVIAPLVFRYVSKEPKRHNDPLMSVTFDVAALPMDGRFRFDDKRVEYAESSKQNEMKLFICRQLRLMLDRYPPLGRGTPIPGLA
eukprot:6179463-Pleurochrysis_carterae.AAC.4